MMETLKFKISMLTIASWKHSAAGGEGAAAVAQGFQTEEEEREFRGQVLCQTRSRDRQPYAINDRYGDNHHWHDDVWMMGPKRDQQEMFDRDYPTNKFDKMKHVAKKARKFGSAFAKLAVKSGMQNFTIDGKEVKEQDIGEADGDETRREILLAVVLYRKPVFGRTMSLLARISMMPDDVIERILVKLDDFDIACFAATCRRFRTISLAVRPRAPNIPVRITLPVAFARNAVQSRLGDRYIPMGAVIGLPGVFSRYPLAYGTWFKSHLPENPDQSVVSQWSEIRWTPEIHSLGELHNVVTMILKKSDDQKPELIGGYHIWSQTKYLSAFRTIAEMNEKVMGNARMDRLWMIRNRSTFD